MSDAGIFISYRRSESEGHAGRLYDWLSEYFGEERVFMDVRMKPGVDFAEQIEDEVGSCGALVALIGDTWLTVTDEDGNRRIDDPADIHRLEIEAALGRGVRVIPGLVRGAEMPGADELPETLRPLLRRHAVELSSHRWGHDVDGLIAVLEDVLITGEGDGWRQRVRKAWAAVRRVSIRHPWRTGCVAGVIGSLIAVGSVLAATGYFSAPLLKVSSFTYRPPKPGESIAQRCAITVESEYVIRKVHFFVDDSRNFLIDQNASPWECNNLGERNKWDTCYGHSTAPHFRLAPDRPHRLTAIATDHNGNTTSKTIEVDTSCPS
jgi:hypothetical protein